MMNNLLKEGLIAEPLELMEPAEKQESLAPHDAFRIYHQTLKDMGVHNEAIDRMTGRYVELDERNRRIQAAKAAHAERIAQAQKAGKADRRRRNAFRVKTAIKRRLRELKRTRKPKLP